MNTKKLLLLIVLGAVCKGEIVQNETPTETQNPQRDAATAEFNAISAEIQNKVRASFYEATAFPESNAARQLPDIVDSLSRRLSNLPGPPIVLKIVEADKHRLLAYLSLAEARIYGALADSGRAPHNEDFKSKRTQLARAALENLRVANKWLAEAQSPADPEFSSELASKITKSRILPHIHALEATAYSILWVLEGKKSDRSAARASWSQIADVGFLSEYDQPASEVEKTLDIKGGKQKAGGMNAVSWVGIGLLVLGLIAAVFVTNANTFQQWAVRVIIAIGAAMTATVIPGLLNINIPEYIAAGGALAVIVLIYLFNPPRHE
ncbi:MAG: hypothetical protein QOG67_3645 [Verrucomicrobiota bacterium]|jgi:hypothetical protein